MAEAGDRPDGGPLIVASWLGTALYLAVAAGATAAPDPFTWPLVVVTVGLFALGTLAFLGAYVVAIARSRDEAIGMGGLYFLAGTAPVRVRRHLIGSFLVQVAVAVVTASVGLVVLPADRDNVLAFGTLAPMYGLGLAGWWGARHGTFPARRVAGDAGATPDER